MDASVAGLPAGDPKLIATIVSHLKSQGLFDQFRRDCIADVDTKPAYQNLRHRVENYVANFLHNRNWRPDLNKNQLRDDLRRHINESGMLATGVDHVVEQVVNPKVYRMFTPQIESVVLQLLGRAPRVDQFVTNLSIPPPQIKMEEPSPPYEVFGTVSATTDLSPTKTSIVPSIAAEALAQPPSNSVAPVPVKDESDFVKNEDVTESSESVPKSEPCKNTVETQTDASVFDEESSDVKSGDENTRERKKSIGAETEPDSTTTSKDIPKKENVKKEPQDSDSHDGTKSKEKRDKVKSDNVKKDGKSKSTDAGKKPEVKAEKVKPASSEKVKSSTEDKSKHSTDVKKAHGESKPKVSDSGKLKSDHKHSAPVKSGSKERTPNKSSTHVTPEKTGKTSQDGKSSGDGNNKQKSVSGIKNKPSSSSKSSDGSKHRSLDGGSSNSESKPKSHEHKTTLDESGKALGSTDSKSKHSKQLHFPEKQRGGDKKPKTDDRLKKQEGKSKDDKISVKTKATEEKKHKTAESRTADGGKLSGQHHRSKSQENVPTHSKDPSKQEKDKMLKDKHHDKCKRSTPEKIVKLSSEAAGSSSERKRHSSESKVRHSSEKSSDEKNKVETKCKLPETMKEKHKDDKGVKVVKKKDEHGIKNEAVIVVSKIKLSFENPAKTKNETGDREKHAAKQVDAAVAKSAHPTLPKHAPSEQPKSEKHAKSKAEKVVKDDETSDETSPTETFTELQSSNDKEKVSENIEPAKIFPGSGEEDDKPKMPEPSPRKCSPSKSKSRKPGNDDGHKSDGGLSDVTVSSVHTSDLSDFDDRITLTDSGDEERGSSRSPRKRKSSKRDSAESPEKVPSPQKPRRGRKKKTQSVDDPDFVEHLPSQPERQAKPAPQTEDHEPRRELRRQRKINPRYSSDEFASIFSKGKDKLHLADMDDIDEEPVEKPRRSPTVKSSTQEECVPKRGRKSTASLSSVEQGSSHELELPYSPRSVGSTKDGRPPSPKSDISFDSSHTSHGPTTPDSMASSEGRRRLSVTQSHDAPTRGRRRGRPSDQRYNSTDLYKPRPVITSSSRRNRPTTPPPCNEDEDQSCQDDEETSDLGRKTPAERPRQEILVRHDYKTSPTDPMKGFDEPVVKRGRGRPRKRPVSETEDEDSLPKKAAVETSSTGRPRGRPKLNRDSPAPFGRRRK